MLNSPAGCAGGTFGGDLRVAVGVVALGIATPGDGGVDDDAVGGDGLGLKQTAADARQVLAQIVGAELTLDLQLAACEGTAESAALLVEHGDGYLTRGLDSVLLLRGFALQTGLRAKTDIGGQRGNCACRLLIRVSLVDGVTLFRAAH